MGTDNPADTVKDVSSASTDLTLIDYFAVVGLDRSLGLQYSSGKADCVDDISVTENITKPPLERSYVSSILAHFPDSRAGYPFPNEIVSLCMPKGLRFFTQKNVPSAAVHTFVNIREDGSRIHGCALIFYEEVSDSSLCDRMSELQTEHVRALTARDKNSDRTHIPPGTVSGGTHTLPRGRRKDRHKRASFYDASSGSRLFMSKCMCIISRIPIVSAGSRILEALYSIFSSPSQPPPLPLESYIYWALNEVPLPAPGSTLKVGLNGSDIILQRPGPSELPFFDYSLASLFKLISIDKFLRLFTCFLLEHQILLCSKFLSPLMLVAESLCALAFPFRWQLTYVPILPYSQLKFMEAPVPYIMGLCYEDALPDQIFQSNICVLDIDSGQLDMPEDVPPFPDKAEFGREITDVLDSVQLAGERNCSNEDLPKLRSQENTAVYEKEEWSSKRMSKSFDEDALSLILGGSSERKNSAIEVVTRGPPSKGNLVPLPLEDIFKQSEILARVTAIARKAGVSVPMDNIEKELLSNDNYTNSPVCRNYFQNVKINNAIREVFVNRFCWMLCSYEHFVIGGSFHDREMFFMSRDSIVNFDKAAFLSDQPQSHLAFLAAFLETQMFTSFIDLKILSQWDTPDENLRLFDQRIQLLNERHGLQVVRTPTYESALPSLSAEEAIAKREESLDYVVSQPHALAGAMHRCYDGTFPELNETLLEGSLTRSPVPSPWKQRHKRLRPKHQEILISSADHLKRSSAYLGGDPKQMAEQNWKFVQQLLKETKAKTKRMLVEKMGKEAVQLGHDEANVNGLEENTLVASFCDLLERIWAHGLIVKQVTGFQL
ncbi:hypothetical protein AB6A40_004330 [Gnathostoma spinigerum]|uniref:UDENN domain-containing protein n=1 Tax=Gnathostoma spinigerum TaxID=75299 RepID=A0ABD6EJM8_9BILA